jgi:octaprenyl-diphosphate synthase
VNTQLPANTSTSGKPAGGRVSAFRLVDNELAQVRELIDKQLADCPAAAGTMSHLRKQVRSGKMLRPGLLLLAGAGCGEVTDKHIRVAAIVEMIHNATLLHDDVIDEGQKRRGGPTVNSLSGNESAVLLGDFLLSKAFRMCAGLEPEVVSTIALAAVRICTGELRQLTEGRNWQLSEAEYIEVITEKSASLFGCCCHLGGLLSGASETVVRMLADFGLNVGIAFQITDDLLDIIGNESKTGKTLGSDVEKDKPTLAVIHLLATMDEERKSALMSKLKTAGESKEVLAEMLKSSGSLEYARNCAQQFISKAVAALADLKESRAKEALIETAGFIGRRAV